MAEIPQAVLSKQTKKAVSKGKNEPEKRNRIFPRSPFLTSNLRKLRKHKEIIQRELKTGKKRINFHLPVENQTKENIDFNSECYIKSSKGIFNIKETDANKISEKYKQTIKHDSPGRTGDCLVRRPVTDETVQGKNIFLTTKLKKFEKPIIHGAFHLKKNPHEISIQNNFILNKEKTMKSQKQLTEQIEIQTFTKCQKEALDKIQKPSVLKKKKVMPQKHSKTQYNNEKPQVLLTKKLQENSVPQKKCDKVLHKVCRIGKRNTELSTKPHENCKQKNFADKTTPIDLEKDKTVESNRKKEKKILHTQNITDKPKITKERMNSEAKKIFAKPMNSDKVILKKKDQPMNIGEKRSKQVVEWDDDEGFLKVQVGDILDNRYYVKNILGKGVFANVVRAQDNKNETMEVAIKIIRNNGLMYKRSIIEVSLLKEIEITNTNSTNYCVKYYTHFLYKGHLCLVLEPMRMDLRTFLRRAGKHGFNLKYVAIYSKQLFIALNHLKQLGIIHADIKPDNILVNDQNDVVKLCDFGSAIRFEDNEPIAYLVSRFYRAPEVILGLPLTCAIDTWATACTIYEITTGRILFVGSTNNKMLKCIMELKGKFPIKLIRRGKFKNEHFNMKNTFLLHKKKELDKNPKSVEIINVGPSRDLLQELKKYSKNMLNEGTKLRQLENLLDKMLALDPGYRISIENCLTHSFIQG